MDFETTLERVKDETHRRSPEDEIYAARGLETAIRFFKRKRFFFNEASIAGIVLGTGVQILTRGDTPANGEFPEELIRPIVVKHRANGSSSNWSRPLTPFTISHEPPLVEGEPRYYGMMVDEIKLLPITREAKEVTIGYIKDIGTPMVKKGSEGTWMIYVNGELVAKTYTNAWFQEAQDLIVARCCYQMFMGPYSNEEKAKRYNALVQDAYHMLDRQASNFAEVGDAVPWGQEVEWTDYGL